MYSVPVYPEHPHPHPHPQPQPQLREDTCTLPRRGPPPPPFSNENTSLHLSPQRPLQTHMGRRCSRWNICLLVGLMRGRLLLGLIRRSGRDCKLSVRISVQDDGCILNECGLGYSHHVLLRDPCRCPQCYHPVTKQRLFNTFDVSAVFSVALNRDITIIMHEGTFADADM